MECVFSAVSSASYFKPLRKVYLLYGEEERQKDEVIDLLRKTAVDPSFADFDFEQLDADSAGADRILSAVGLAPFASPVRLVVVRRAELYRRREMAADAERLASGINSLGSSACLVLRAGAPDDEGARGNTVLHSKLDAAIKVSGLLLRFRAQNEDQVAEWISAEVQRAGKQINEDATRLILEMTGQNRASMSRELEKVICFAGEARVISGDMVESVLSHDAEDVTFKLVDAVSQKNADRAFYLFAELLRYDTKPHSVAGRVLALLARQFSLLWQARELSERRIRPQDLKNLPEEVAEKLPADGSIVSLAWKAGDLFRLSRSWSRGSLARALEMLVECDVNNKGGGEGSEDVRRNLDVLILRLCSLP